MKYIKLFEDFINEGGWSTVKTQNTVLNPQNIKKTVEVVKRVGDEFNKYLKSIDLPPLDIVRPVGSGTWWEDDLQNNPDKVYGDVDFLVVYPVLELYGDDENKNEIESVKLYNDELLTWLKRTKPKGIDVEETDKISALHSVKLVAIIDVDGTPGYVQVDYVVSYPPYKEWALARLTPIRNVKGFVLGKLYASFGYVLDMSVQFKGVRAKIKDNIIVPYAKRKDVKEVLVSNNIKTFLLDIANFIWTHTSDKPFKPTKDLVDWKMDNSNPTLEDLFGGIKAFANTMDQLDEFGAGIKYKTKDDFLKAVIKRYEEAMMKAYNASKFDKAQSQQAKDTIIKIRKMIDDHIAKIKSLV